VKDWIIARLSEESTWRGIILVVTGLGVKIAPDMAQSIIALGLAAVGVINVAKQQAASKADVAAAVESNNVQKLGLEPSDPAPPRAVVIEAAPKS